MKHSTLTMFRRVMAMTLALLLVVGLTGCFGKEKDTPTEPVADPTTAPTIATEAPTEKPTEAATEAPTEPAVKGVMGTVSANNLNVRSNPSTDSTVLSQLPVNLRIEVLEQKSVGGTNWGRIADMTLTNGTKVSGGWLNLHYVKLDTTETETPAATESATGNSSGTTTVDPDEEALGTVTAEQLTIRKGAGTTYDSAGTYKKGDRVKILEKKTVSGTTWGRTEKGWISMTYVKLDGSAGSAVDTGTNVKQPGATTPTTSSGSSSSSSSSSGSTAAAVEVSNGKTSVLGYVVVDTDGLTLRAGPGTNYKSLGTADEGDRYPYYQTSSKWYRTSHGWLSNASDAYLYIEGTTADDAGIAVIKAKEMYVRQGPGTNFKSITTLKEGESLVVLGRADGWGYTRLGWINIDTDYVTFSKGLTYTTGNGEVLVDGLNVREGASTEAKSIDSLDKGDKVKVTEISTTDKSWGKITYGTTSKTGWINLSYLKMTSASSSTQTPTEAPTEAPTTPATKYDVVVTYSTPSMGTVKPAALEYAKGEEVVLTVAPISGKMVDTITVKDAANATVKVTKVSNTKYTFIMPESKATVVAAFTDYVETFQITTSAGVSASHEACAAGTTVTLTVTEAAGKVLDKLEVKKTGGTDTVPVSSNQFTMPAYAVTVTATFKNEYTVTVKTATNGEVTADKTAACKDDKVTLTINAAVGYTMDTVKVNGTAVTLDSGKFTMPDADATVEVTFKENLDTTTAGSYKTKAALNFHVKPDPASDVKGQIPADTTVTVVGTVNGLAKVEWNSTTVYVDGSPASIEKVS